MPSARKQAKMFCGMPQQGTIFRALIASPSDCATERKIISDVISHWNAVYSLERAAIVEPVLWETHSRPALGEGPQQIINDQLVGQCDFLVGTFWTKLGTPTMRAESGTAEEIEHFRAANKPVMLYFSAKPVVPDSYEPDQYKSLVEYRDRLGRQGLYFKYESDAEFRDLLHRHLAATMLRLLQKTKPHTQVVADENSRAEYEQQNAALQTLRRDFSTFLRRTRAQWNAEKDSDPFDIVDGKIMLGRAEDELLGFRSMITHDTSGVSERLEQAL